MSIRVDDIRACMEGAIPGVIATCAPDGTPNLSLFSQVEYVDAEHVALSFQFFNKTRENVLRNPHVTVNVPHPYTGATYRLELEYLRTEVEGPLFERMKAKLAGIASHEGMSDVFRLKGSDIYRVHRIVQLPGDYPSPPHNSRNLLAAARTYADHVGRCTDLNELLDVTLADIDALFGIQHAMILMLDASGDHLYTVASRGYAESGTGSEVPADRGIIGVAVRARCPIRISFTAPEYSYSRAIREQLAHSEHACMLETAIPFPGLDAPRSQLAVPIVAPQRTLGAIYADSDANMRFSYEDEDALMIVAAQLGTAARTLAALAAEPEAAAPRPMRGAAKTNGSVVVRHFTENHSVFLGDTYLIKGVAGAIFWKLVNDYSQTGRRDFTNKELRLDPKLRFPDINDNLEARLILLQRRLSE
ncbi:MAG TPA: GAF domain-containing protein, partial [Gammaproteobacteria bacterium]|nr:GAF domain-containing protein [Gammaproteobacteria bacterium]